MHRGKEMGEMTSEYVMKGLEVQLKELNFTCGLWAAIKGIK